MCGKFRVSEFVPAWFSHSRGSVLRVQGTAEIYKVKSHPRLQMLGSIGAYTFDEDCNMSLGTRVV